MAYGNILFVISDTGGGHRSAAEAMIEAVRRIDGDRARCSITDLLRETEVPLVRSAPEIYGYCSTRQVWLHDLFFRFTNEPQRLDMLSKVVYSKARENIKRVLRENRPDLVVVAHPLALRLMCAARREMRAQFPLITVVTDLATIHASWACNESDLYLVPTREAHQALINHGIPEYKLLYTGFPVHPKFFDPQESQSVLRRKLEIDAEKKTVLLTSGGAGGGKVRELVETIENQRPDWQLLVVTGNNRELYNTLKNRSGSYPLTHVFGFARNMERLMIAADVVATKAGPGTIMEARALRRPLVVTGAVGLQETGNIDYVSKNRYGLFAPDAASLVKALDSLGTSQSAPEQTQLNNIVDNGSNRIAGVILEKMQWAKDLPA
ncbi:MAG: Monogalactosyldiacylglycerol synthase [Firmicutes bacterium]|nr:Monogalactosyldiacylglycerol synthase [Bacillota bacterium]